MKSLAVSFLLACCSTAYCQNESGPAKLPLTTKIYRIDGFRKLATPTNHAVAGNLAVPVRQMTVIGGGSGSGGLGGGGGFGGGGFGGGGGFFSVPEPMGSQFGQSPSLPAASADNSSSPSLSHEIVNLICNCVDPSSWQHSGGEGVIETLGDALVVRQTDTNHAAISELLKALRVEAIGEQALAVALWLIKADRTLEQQVPELINSKDADQKLTEIAESTQGYHVEIRTMDRLNATISDGSHTAVIASQIPVTGTNSSGYQPVIQNVFEGFSAAVHPRMIPAAEGNGIQLTVSTHVTAIRDLVRRETSGRETDTFYLQSQDLNGTVLCQLNKPIVVSSLSVRDAHESSVEQWILVGSVSSVTKEDTMK